MKSKVSAVNRLPGLPLYFLGLFVLLQPTWSAIVAQEKVKEMVEQAHVMLNASTSESELRLLENGGENGIGTTELVQPLSLQIAVLHVTDALSREMNLPKWQAMLRALGGDREILKRFTQLRPHFAALEKRLIQGQDGGTEEQLDQLAALNTSSTTWTRIWPQLQTFIQTVANLHDWFDRYQRNAAVVNERTLRDYAETVHGTDGLTISRALASIHKAVCPSSTSEDDMESANNNTDTCSGGVLETLQVALTQVCINDFVQLSFFQLKTNSCFMFSLWKLDWTHQQAGDSFICSLPKSTHQLVYDLYALLTLTDAKGYAMMQFSWMLLRLYGRGT